MRGHRFCVVSLCDSNDVDVCGYICMCAARRLIRVALDVRMRDVVCAASDWCTPSDLYSLVLPVSHQRQRAARVGDLLGSAARAGAPTFLRWIQRREPGVHSGVRRLFPSLTFYFFYYKTCLRADPHSPITEGIRHYPASCTVIKGPFS